MENRKINASVYQYADFKEQLANFERATQDMIATKPAGYKSE